MNIPDDELEYVIMTLEEARDTDNDDAVQRILEALDEAQAHVFSGERKRSFVVIEINV